MKAVEEELYNSLIVATRDYVKLLTYLTRHSVTQVLCNNYLMRMLTWSDGHQVVLVITRYNPVIRLDNTRHIVHFTETEIVSGIVMEIS